MLDVPAAVHLADRRIGENAVRNGVDGIVFCADLAAAHPDMRDNAVDVSRFDSVPEAERAVRNDDHGSEEVRYRVLCCQRDGKSDDSRARQERRDVKPENVLSDEKHGRDADCNLERVSDQAHRQVVQRVVASFREFPDLPVHHRDQPENPPCDDKRGRGVEETHVQLMQRARQTPQNRKEKEETRGQDKQEDHRRCQDMQNLPAQRMLSVIHSLPRQASEQPRQKYARQN